MSYQFWMGLGSLLGFIGVGAGAMGAHMLSTTLSEKSLSHYQTASQFLFYHAFALLIFGLWISKNTNASQIPGWFFIIGVTLFCGSLYILSFTGMKFLGAITPFGGISFMLGWLTFAYFIFKN